MTPQIGRLSAVPAFFGLRVVSGLLLLKLAASFLPIGGFAIFSQLVLFAGLLNLAAVAGTQNGLIREAAASDDPDTLARIRRAGFVLWALAAPPLGLVITLCAAP